MMEFGKKGVKHIKRNFVLKLPKRVAFIFCRQCGKIRKNGKNLIEE